MQYAISQALITSFTSVYINQKDKERRSRFVCDSIKLFVAAAFFLAVVMSAEVTGDKLYHEESQKRRDILINSYPIYTFENNGEVENHGSQLGKRTVNCAYGVDGDGILEGKMVCFENDKGYVNLNGNFESPIDIQKDDIVVMEFDNKSDSVLPCIRITLYDKRGEAVERYLKQINPGKSNICFSPNGFVETKADFSKIASFQLRIYTSSLDDDKQFEINLGNLYKFNSSYEWYEYLATGEYDMEWEIQ